MKKAIIVFVFLSLLFNIFTIINYFYFLQVLSAVTGRGTIATIGLIVLSPLGTVTIQSPENATYNFSAVANNYTLFLNVSADFNVAGWRYRLEDLKHSTVVNSSVSFTPNTTINAVRWSNLLTVFANNSNGNEANASVVFYIRVPNSAPLLGGVERDKYVCEGNYLSYNVNATDIDEDDLTFGINPVGDPFFIRRRSQTVNIGLTLALGEIYSGVLVKGNIGNYSREISVRDGGVPEYSDSAMTNITVIEINNAPTVGNVGVQTVWSSGENSTFYKEVQVSDTENGNQSSGNFTFNLTFLNGNKFFDVSRFGIMNFTANSSVVGVYNLSLCVIDRALANIHSNISLCGQDGLNQTNCQNFSLTVTNQNRAPRIVSYYPTNFSFNVSGSDNLVFNVSKTDPDGTIPDSYWYVADVRKGYYSGASVDSFTYSFGCGVSGEQKVRVDVTDGGLNASLQWNISVGMVDCPIALPGGGGGGGGESKEKKICIANWACYSWSLCQSTKRTAEEGILTGEEFRNVSLSCTLNNWIGNICGYQTRNCIDLNSCNSTAEMPEKVQGCYFTVSPNCEDNIKNCHDGSCEFLVDCGGPCKPCPTCSDRIQNQGEENVDCGGPCPKECPKEKPAKKMPSTYLIVVLIILLIILSIRMYRVYLLSKKEKKKTEKIKN